MIDREIVAKIARFTIQELRASKEDCIDRRETAAVLSTVDEFSSPEPTGDEIAAEIERINMEYLAQNARKAVLHYLREGWAKERIARRKEREANSR